MTVPAYSVHGCVSLRFLNLVRIVSIVFGLFILSASVSLAQTTQKRRLITAEIDENKLTVLHGNTHPLARPEFDRGAAPSSLVLHRMLLVLTRSPEQEATLKALLDQQQDKSPPNYHQWLKPAEFGQTFGPADEDVQAVAAWLRSRGFQVTSVTKGRGIVEFSGTVAQVNEAFHTEIHKYVVNGEEHWGNSSDPQIPSALASVVGGIATLHNFIKQPNIVSTGQRAYLQRGAKSNVNLCKGLKTPVRPPTSSTL